MIDKDYKLEREKLKESVKSIESLLHVKFYYKNGHKTEEGRTYSTLAALRDGLYKGSWEKMLKDLNARLNDKSHKYFFKLVDRMKGDIKRIERLEEAEKNNKNITDILTAYYYNL